MMVDSLPPDHYAALGLGKQATLGEVKTAYKKAALKYHPDKAKDQTNAADLFHKISQAYETLIDDEKRRKWEDQCRSAQLKKEIQDRRRPGPPSSAYGGVPMQSRMPNGDVRFAYTPRAPFNTAPSYATQSRRPRNTSPDDEFASRFEASRSTARNHPPEYMRSPQQPARPPPSKSEDYRKVSREIPKNKIFEAGKKRQDQNRQQERLSKRQPTADSSESDSGSDGGRARRDRDDDFARRSSAAHRPHPYSSDPYYGDRWNDATDYIGRTRRNSPPPSHRQEAFRSEMPPTRDRPSMDTRESYESRASSKRMPPSRQNTNDTVPRSRAASIRETSNTRRTRSKTPDEEQRPGSIPTMQHSMSSPAGGGPNGPLPKMAATSTRRSTVPDAEKTPRQGPNRANTMPMPERTTQRTDKYNPSLPRRSSEQPAPQRPPPLHHGPSGLRQAAPQEDSGYSTSNSPSEETPQKENVHFNHPSFSSANVSTKKVYTYSTPSTGAASNNDSMNVHVSESPSDADTEEDRSPRTQTHPQFSQPFRDGRTEIRTPAKMAASRTPSPPPPQRSRANSSAQRTAAHPPSHSTKGPPPSSYNRHAQERDRDPYHPSKHPDANVSATPRRPSLSRSNSARTTRAAEKPRLERSTTGMPGVNGMFVNTNVGPGSKHYFGQVVDSPLEMTNERSDGEKGSGGESGREKGRGSGGERDRERDSGKEGRRSSGKDRERDRDRDGGKEKSRKGSRHYEEMTEKARKMIEKDRQSAKKSPRAKGWY